MCPNFQIFFREEEAVLKFDALPVNSADLIIIFPLFPCRVHFENFDFDKIIYIVGPLQNFKSINNELHDKP